jgi:hypothetical protein
MTMRWMLMKGREKEKFESRSLDVFTTVYLSTYSSYVIIDRPSAMFNSLHKGGHFFLKSLPIDHPFLLFPLRFRTRLQITQTDQMAHRRPPMRTIPRLLNRAHIVDNLSLLISYVSQR